MNSNTVITRVPVQAKSAYEAVVEDSSTSVLKYPQKIERFIRRILGLDYGHYSINLHISKNDGMKWHVHEIGKMESNE